MDNDEILWQGLLNGDKEMFLALYKKYYHSLLFIGIKDIKDSELVKDTIQQLFLYFWEKRSSLNEAKNVKSYIITSFLRKLSVDWKKSSQFHNLLVVENNFSSDTQPTPEEKLISKDEQGHAFRLLMKYIDELPKRQKELIFLRFYDGLSYEEIVQKTGLSHRTIYNKIHEALKKLKLNIVASKHIQTASLLFLVTLIATSDSITSCS